MNKIKVGIIGYGKSGQVFHAPLIDCMDEFELKSIYTKNGDAIKMSKVKYPNSKIVNDINEITNDREIDLVVIATPNYSHFNLAKNALENNKNVVVDKPFTTNCDEANELIKISKKKNKVLSIFHNRRFDSDFKTIMKLTKANILGNIVEYESHYDRFRNSFKGNWREKNIPGAGILYDLGSHLIDQALVLFDMPNKIFADIRVQKQNGQVDDNFELILFYDNLKVTLKAGNLVKENLPKYILLGEKGTFVKYGIDIQEKDLQCGLTPKLKTNWGQEDYESYGRINYEVKGLNIEGKIKSECGLYSDFYMNIYKAIVERCDLLIKPEEALKVIKIIEAAKKSSAELRIVNL